MIITGEGGEVRRPISRSEVSEGPALAETPPRPLGSAVAVAHDNRRKSQDPQHFYLKLLRPLTSSTPLEKVRLLNLDALATPL